MPNIGSWKQKKNKALKTATYLQRGISKIIYAPVNLYLSNKRLKICTDKSFYLYISAHLLIQKHFSKNIIYCS